MWEKKQRPILVPAKSSQPRETNHLGMPVVQRCVKTLQAACLRIRKELLYISQELFGGEHTCQLIICSSTWKVIQMSGTIQLFKKPHMSHHRVWSTLITADKHWLNFKLYLPTCRVRIKRVSTGNHEFCYKLLANHLNNTICRAKLNR